ncbi:hypothetical protein [Janthinobacterium sp. PC23-8]|uniref:hypothetical protein n=1 Tax=Janthinobacterium sp. PC23-8 TaxID=2012679 RepID=UPI00114012A6|nr:hypothetical protein [Janthinobacterium sp. PC23-8]
MKIFTYPYKKFFSHVKFEIKKGNDIYIEISNSWKTKLITAEVIKLIINEESEEKSWKFVFCMILNPGFFSTYFYAYSENYRIDLIDEKKRLIKFYKIKNIEN